VTPIGIDVSKHHLDIAALQPTGETLQQRLPNTPQGHTTLVTWLEGTATAQQRTVRRIDDSRYREPGDIALQGAQ
jgi:type II secretory pathway component PulM